MNKNGFTLIELMVVMVIIAILVLLGMPRFLGYTKDAKAVAIQQDTKILTDAANRYHNDYEYWPTGDSVLTITVPHFNEGAPMIAARIEKGALNSYVNHTRNQIQDYALILDGGLEGEVVHVKTGQPPQEDKAGNQIFSNILRIEPISGAVGGPRLEIRPYTPTNMDSKKNLIDSQNLEYGKFSYETGTFNVPSYHIRMKHPIPIKENTLYYVNEDFQVIVYFDAAMNFLSYRIRNATHGTFKTPVGARYLRARSHEPIDGRLEPYKANLKIIEVTS